MSGQQRKAPLKGDALVNKVALIVIEIIFVALIFAYIPDYIAGYASKIYFIIFEITAINIPIQIRISINSGSSKQGDKAVHSILVMHPRCHLFRKSRKRRENINYLRKLGQVF